MAPLKTFSLHGEEKLTLDGIELLMGLSSPWLQLKVGGISQLHSQFWKSRNGSKQALTVLEVPSWDDWDLGAENIQAVDTFCDFC